MTLAAYRIVKRKHARTAFSGEGARRFGGRWNSPGVAVAYASATQSLAALEMLVHLDAAELLGHYVAFRAEFDESLVEWLEPAALPRTWRAEPPPARLRILGDHWATEARTPVLAVPSAVIPAERNFLLNPRHPNFGRVSFGEAIGWRFDPRLA